MPTGRLAKKPMRQLARAETAAVVVMRSRCTTARHWVYESSGATTQSTPSGQTQVPPESTRMAALTEICAQGKTIRASTDTQLR
jgi:hypothetical protein